MLLKTVNLKKLKYFLFVILTGFIFNNCTSLSLYAEQYCLAPRSINNQEENNHSSDNDPENLSMELFHSGTIGSNRESVSFSLKNAPLSTGNSTFVNSDETTFGIKTQTTEKGLSELLVAMFNNVMVQIQFTGEENTRLSNVLNMSPIPLETSGESRYGLETEYELLLDQSNQTVFMDLPFFGDGRTRRDMERMNEGVDPRALKDVFSLLEEGNSSLPFVDKIELKKNKNIAIIQFQKNIKNEKYTFTLELSHPEGKNMEKVKIIKSETDDSKSLPYFVLNKIEKINDPKIKAILKKIKQLMKAPNEFKRWLKLYGLNYRTLSNTSSMPAHYKGVFQSLNENEIDVLEILTHRYKIVFPKDFRKVKIQVKFEKSYEKENYRPFPLEPEEMFNSKMLFLSWDFLGKTKTSISKNALKFRNMLLSNLKGIQSLVFENTVLAGAFTYLTYFGRDTMLSYLLLKPFLQDGMKVNFLAQLLNRSNHMGEAAHEIDSRISRGEESHYDYRMADTDFLLSVGCLDFINESIPDKISRFLNLVDERNRYNLTLKDKIPNGLAVFRNLNYTLNQIQMLKLISVKHQNDPSSGNWRDALDSLGRAAFPYDINAVWIPHQLRLLIDVTANREKYEIILKYISGLKEAFPEENFETLEFFLANVEELTSLLDSWEKKKDIFKVEFDLFEWRERLLDFYEANPDSSNLKNMTIGYYLDENGVRKYKSSLDFLEDERFNKLVRLILEKKLFLPDGNLFPQKLEFFALGLDNKQRPVPVMHSDHNFELFTRGSRRLLSDKNIMTPFELPLSLGGLAIINEKGESLGFSVANPMLSKNGGYDLLLTEEEISQNVIPQNLSPWTLLGKKAYHGWGAVWGVMIDFFTAGVAMHRQYDFQNGYLDNIYNWTLSSYLKMPNGRNEEVLGFEYDEKEKDFIITESSIENIEINPTQVWNIAGIIRTVLDILQSNKPSHMNIISPAKSFLLQKAA